MYEEVSEQTLEGTAKRATRLLRGIGTRVEIRNTMESVGYDGEEQRRGWQLVGRVRGTRKVRLVNDHDEKVQAAIVEIDAVDEQIFRRSHAAMGRLHPAQDAYVFADLSASRDPDSLVGMATFLDRLDELESSPEREATRSEDQAAIATLARRGIDAEYGQQLREIIAIGQSAEFPVELEPEAAVEGERMEALRELRAWYEDWAETARSVVSRRDHLILMGLAHRRVTALQPPDTASGQGTPAASEAPPAAGD